MCEFIGHEVNRCEAYDKLAEAMGTEVSLAEARIAEYKRELDGVKSWLREAREGWAGSDREFTDAYGDLAEMLGVEFTEEIDIELTFRMTARIKMPIGYELDTNDFWVKHSPTIDTQTDDVELLSNEDLYVDEVDVNS